MWLIIPVVVLIILAVVGAVLVSGVFAAVLLPIAAIALLLGLIAIGRRASDPEFRERLNAKRAPPLGASGGVAHKATAPSTPDDVVEARRQAQ